MTDRPADRPPERLLGLALPLVVSFSLRFLFTFVDLGYAALLDDDASAVAAIGLYIPFQGFYIALWVGLSAGLTANLSRAFGHRDGLRVCALRGAVKRLLAVLVPTLVGLGIAVWLLIPHLGLDPDLARAFRAYAPTLLIGMPLTGFWSILPDSIVKAHYDTKSTMVAGILASGTNVALNTLFVFGFGWGVFGLALGTVLSRIPALVYAWSRAAAHETRRRAEAGGWDNPRAWPSPPLRSILLLAIPGGLTYALAASENSFVFWILAGLPAQKLTIATYGVYHQLSMLALMPTVAASVAVLPYVARSVAEGRHAQVRADLNRTLLVVAGFAVALTLPTAFVFARPLAEFFTADAQAAVAVGDAAVNTLRWLPVSVLAAVPFLLLRPVFEALHQPRIGVLVALSRFLLFAMPAVIAARYLAPAAGLDPLTGVVVGLATAMALASTLTFHLARLRLRAVAA